MKQIPEEYSKEEVIAEFKKLMRWIEESIQVRGRANGKDCEFSIGLWGLYYRTVELLEEQNKKGTKNGN